MARLDKALALGRGGGDRFVALAIALKAFFATLTLAGLVSLDHAVARWQSGDRTVATALLPADSPPEVRAAALDALRDTPGVARAEAMSGDAVAALIAPWLGGRNPPDDLPLPVTIDIRVHSHGSVDWPAAEARLRAAAPDALLDAGPAWIGKLVELARAAQGAAVAALVLVAVVAALTVAFATRAAWAAHRGAIELVHWLGARDREVLAAFQRRALWLGLCGGAPGTAAALAILYALGRVARGLDAPLLLDLAPPPETWPVFAAVPLAGALVSALAARRVVRSALSRMP